MSRSTFGTRFTITTWGESHGEALGVVVDGCPAGLCLTAEDVQTFLDRRKPGKSRFVTARQETDQVRILSGVFEGKTTGTPISMMVFNQDHRSADYSRIADVYRPGHADYTFDQKYGFRDYRGGGRSSGRETLSRVAGGAVACRFLSELGIRFRTYTSSIGPVTARSFDPEEIERNPFCLPDANAAKEAAAYLEDCMARRDSTGGVIECRIEGVPAGIGDPVFGKLDALFAQALMSIGAVKAVGIGDGTAVSRAKGSENNDPFTMEDGSVTKLSNHAGGVLGGISDGSTILLRAHVKPTPSIGLPQQTVSRSGEACSLTIEGRHDPVIVPRAVVVVESMAALVLADSILLGMTSRLDRIRDFYQKS